MFPCQIVPRENDSNGNHFRQHHFDTEQGDRGEQNDLIKDQANKADEVHPEKFFFLAKPGAADENEADGKDIVYYGGYAEGSGAYKQVVITKHASKDEKQREVNNRGYPANEKIANNPKSKTKF